MKKFTLDALLGLCLAAILAGCTQSRAESAPADAHTNGTSQTEAVPAAPEVAPEASAVADLPEGLNANESTKDVVRLLRAGVEDSVLLTHIRQSNQAFNVGTEEILYLTDLGASGEVINAMMARDNELAAAANAPTAEPVAASSLSPGDTAVGASAGEVPAEPEITGPPDEEVTVEYFHDYLTPYGVWVDIPGYGRCWQPTVAVTTSGWMPYADAGRWLYTDYGWYWYSDYTWGWAPFHYGRWFHHSSYGWCWSPGTVWGPSWVTWRVTGEYAGWAPLPPSSFISISIGVGWSTPYYWYTYVPSYRICHPYPRHCAVPYSRLEYLHKQARPCNRYAVASDNTIVNRGIDPDQLTSGAQEPVPRTRLVPTSTRPLALRRGETLEDGTGLVRSVQPGRVPAQSELTRISASTSERPTRQVPTMSRTSERETPPNALVMRGVPRTPSNTDGTRSTRRQPSATDERGSYFSARVPPGSIIGSGASDSTRSPTIRREPSERTRDLAPTGTASRSPINAPTRSAQAARPVSPEPTRTAAPASTPTVRSIPSRTPSSPVSVVPSRTSPTTLRSLPSTASVTAPRLQAPAAGSPSMTPNRELPTARTTPYTVPSRSIPSASRSIPPTRSPFESAARSPINSTPAPSARAVPSAPAARFSPYSPASPGVHTPPARTFSAPSQPAAPRVASPPPAPHQPPAASAPPAAPSRSVPSAPARERSAGRSGRE